jgi:hypothetical protein
MSNWQARWIAPKHSALVENYYFRARKKIILLPDKCNELLHISAESTYVLYVNGTKIGSGPVRGTVSCNFVDSYDVREVLQKGENWIAVEVCCNNVSSYKACPAQPALFVQFGNSVITDVSWQVQPAADWRRDVPKYTRQIGFMEWRNMGHEPDGWQIGRDDSQWYPAEVISIDRPIYLKKLLLRDIPELKTSRYYPVDFPVVRAVKQTNDLHNVEVAKLMTEEKHLFYGKVDSLNLDCLIQIAGGSVVVKPNSCGHGIVLILDFGRIIVGGFELDIEGPAGTIVDVGYEEILCDERLALFVEEYRFADRYILRQGRQSIGNTLTERGFRYIQFVIRNYYKPIIIHHISAIDRRYPAIPRGQFESNDLLLNQIWSACIETVSTCTTDVFVDCPWRENAFWIIDMLVENLFWLQVFGDEKISKRCMRLALSQLRDDGVIPGMCPCNGDSRRVLPAANLFLPLILKDYLDYTGDCQLVLDTIDTILSILNIFSSWEDKDTLLTPPSNYWNFIDWSYEHNGINLDGRNSATLNWFYVLSLDAAAGLLSKVGRDDEAKSLADRAKKVAISINNRFWLVDEKRYIEWIEGAKMSSKSNQLTYSLALLSGHISKTHESDVFDAMMRNDTVMPDLFMQHFVLRAMFNYGGGSEAIERIRKYWGVPVRSGSQTIWETVIHQAGKDAFNKTGSLCHGFSCTPISFFQEKILGISPRSDGFTRFNVAPTPLGLNYAKGVVPTPHGDIEISWQNKGEILKIELFVPMGTIACLPDRQELDSGQHQIQLSCDG